MVSGSDGPLARFDVFEVGRFKLWHRIHVSNIASISTECFRHIFLAVNAPWCLFDLAGTE